MSAVSSHASLLSDEDIYLFNEGSHFRIADRLGAQHTSGGSHFGVWAPAATGVSVIGDFNGWEPGANPLSVRGSSGIWEAFVPGAEPGGIYKYRVVDAAGRATDKADPLALRTEVPPRTGSTSWAMVSRPVHLGGLGSG